MNHLANTSIIRCLFVFQPIFDHKLMIMFLLFAVLTANSCKKRDSSDSDLANKRIRDSEENITYELSADSGFLCLRECLYPIAVSGKCQENPQVPDRIATNDLVLRNFFAGVNAGAFETSDLKRLKSNIEILAWDIEHAVTSQTADKYRRYRQILQEINTTIDEAYDENQLYLKGGLSTLKRIKSAFQPIIPASAIPLSLSILQVEQSFKIILPVEFIPTQKREFSDKIRPSYWKRRSPRPALNLNCLNQDDRTIEVACDQNDNPLRKEFKVTVQLENGGVGIGHSWRSYLVKDINDIYYKLYYGHTPSEGHPPPFRLIYDNRRVSCSYDLPRQ